MSEYRQKLGFDIPFSCCGTTLWLKTQQLFQPAVCPSCGKMASERALNQVPVFADFLSDCILEYTGALCGEEIVLELCSRIAKNLNVPDIERELTKTAEFLFKESDLLVANHVALLSFVTQSSTRLVGGAALVDQPLGFDSKSAQTFRLLFLVTAPPSQKGSLLRLASTISYASQSFFNK